MPTVYCLLNKEYLLHTYKVFLMILSKDRGSFEDFFELHTKSITEGINLNGCNFKLEELYFVSYYYLLLL